MYPGKQTNYIEPTYSKLWDSGKLLQLASIHSRIQLKHNLQVGYYLFHSKMKQTMYFSGLPTSSHYHLPLLFHSTKPWLHQHLSQVTADLNRADHWALYPIHHSLADNKNTDTSLSTAML